MGIVDLFLDTRPKLGHIALDCTVSETHAHGVKKTPYPVEHGSSNHDRGEIMPSPITLEGIISDVPAPMVFENIGLDFIEDRSASAYEQLVDLVDSKEPFTVVTSLRTVHRYYFKDGESLVITRDFENSGCLRFTAMLEPWRVAYSSFAEAIVNIDMEDILGESATSGIQSTTTASDNLASVAFEAI